MLRRALARGFLSLAQRFRERIPNARLQAHFPNAFPRTRLRPKEDAHGQSLGGRSSSSRVHGQVRPSLTLRQFLGSINMRAGVDSSRGNREPDASIGATAWVADAQLSGH